MEKNGKIWGETSLLFSLNNVEIHRIEVKEGGVCSLHSHTHKWNLFFVEKGLLEIEVHKNDYALIDKTVLGNLDMMKVAPGEKHRFRALADTVAYEIYWCTLDSADIQRDDVGSRLVLQE